MVVPSAQDPQLVVRARRGTDLPVLLALLQRSHEQDGYPVRASAVRADWLAAPGELMGAVAQHGARVVGHVALHAAPAPGHDPGQDAATALWQQATGAPASRLAVVSRLVTDGTVPGTGTALLTHAVDVAAELDRVPVLLVDPAARARAFYRRRGWREIGTARQLWGHIGVDAVLMINGQP